MDPQALFRAWCARTTAYDVVRVAAAVVLLTAAGLKAHQAATSPVLGDGFLNSRWVLIATVEFEIFFGLWLLANILPVWTRRRFATQGDGRPRVASVFLAGGAEFMAAILLRSSFVTSCSAMAMERACV